MTARRLNPMPRTEIARLGGLSHSREHMSRLGELAWEANQRKYGKRQIHAARLTRLGYNVSPLNTQKAPRGNEGLSKTTEGQSND